MIKPFNPPLPPPRSLFLLLHVYVPCYPDFSEQRNLRVCSPTLPHLLSEFFSALYVFSGNVDITKERRTLYVHKENWTPVLICPTVAGVNENLNENN